LARRRLPALITAFKVSIYLDKANVSSFAEFRVLPARATTKARRGTIWARLARSTGTITACRFGGLHP